VAETLNFEQGCANIDWWIWHAMQTSYPMLTGQITVQPVKQVGHSMSIFHQGSSQTMLGVRLWHRP